MERLKGKNSIQFWNAICSNLLEKFIALKTEAEKAEARMIQTAFQSIEESIILAGYEESIDFDLYHQSSIIRVSPHP